MLTAAAFGKAAEGGLRILVHLEQWESGFLGEYRSVGVLGGYDEVFTVDGSHFNPELTVRQSYRCVSAPCDGASDRVVAYPEGSCLPHEEPGEALAVAGECQVLLNESATT